MIKITIPGKPQGKGRAKVFNGHGVTPENTVLYENLIKTIFMQSGEKKLDGQAALTIYAYYPIPKSKSKKVKEDMRVGRIRPLVKPDIDNIAKACMDALNGLAYEDDKNVVHLKIAKYYSEEPRIEIYIVNDDI